MENLVEITEEVVVSVKKFTTVTPKFSKDTWQSGEGGESDSTGESE
jgi:hypothetical protein